MPAGTLIGVQFMKTTGYVQVTGQFNQVGIDLNPSDYGVCIFFTIVSCPAVLTFLLFQRAS